MTGGEQILFFSAVTVVSATTFAICCGDGSRRQFVAGFCAMVGIFLMLGGLSLPARRPALWLPVSGLGVAMILYGKSQWVTRPGLTTRQTKSVLRHVHAKQQYEQALRGEANSDAVPKKPRPLSRKTAQALKDALDSDENTSQTPADRMSSRTSGSRGDQSAYDGQIDKKWKVTRYE